MSDAIDRALTHRPATPSMVTQTTAVEQARAIAEVQAAVMVAQNCPRDVSRAEGEMRDACGRTALAERAFYRVPNRGSGPSVHLARELARIWGNMQYGVHEMRRDDDAGMSEIQAFAWDVQTNTRSTRTFQVPHQRMKDKKRVELTDLGDVYLNNQNVGARAVRECIFNELPTWYVELAQAICAETLRNGDGEPLPERIEKMVGWFATSFGIRQAQLEEKVGRKRGQWDAGDVATLKVLGTSIQRGEVRVEEEFTQAAGASADDFRPAATPPAPTPEPSPTPEPQPEPKLSARNRGRLFALFTQKGIPEAEQLAGIATVIGRTPSHRDAINEDEFARVVHQLESLPDAQGGPDA